MAVVPLRIPVSTYRLQFNSGFTFRDASAIVEYLHALGVTDCYASSYLAAVPGSRHGYDVADPTRLNPEIGTDEEYWRWIDDLRSRGMGHVLDLVPNHMGIAKSANPWWQDVLENGPSSRFARVFDIEWHPVKDELFDKVLIPILGDQYGAVLERQELRLTYRHGAFLVTYHDNILPIAPDTYSMVLGLWLQDWRSDYPGEDADELQSIVTASQHLPPRHSRDAEGMATRAREKEVVKRRLAALTDLSQHVRAYIEDVVERFNGVLGQPRSFDALDELLNHQSYRLAHWRVASEEINYRRFFDVNGLAAVRMEDPSVFNDVHRFVFELVHRGAATGLRVDHVDGLFAPGEYLRRLQTNAADPEHPESPFYVVVEKILGDGEKLPDQWPVHGTTGYEFAAVVNNLFVDGRNERALDDIYRRFVRDRVAFADLAYRAKTQVLHETMSGDINSLGHQLNRYSERNRHFRDFTLYSLISAIKHIIACFPVYRTYVTEADPVGARDRRYIRDAVSCAKWRAQRVPAMVLEFVERILLKQATVSTPEECHERARFIGKFQQITGPVAAKGTEDTALYIYNRLLSLNEVGADPTRFGLEPAAVHQWLADRARQWPAALSATSTHDTKRGEDVRARLNVLSEIPGAWKAVVSKWRALNRRFRSELKGKVAPDRNEEYLIYQTLVGAWPFEAQGGKAQSTFCDRLSAYMTKAMREAKLHTSWLGPDEEYELAVLRFVDAILDSRRSHVFLQSFQTFQARVAELGVYNSLAQLLIKITAPGVPDFYQGSELWDLNLVDPDNRRLVDYATRRELLQTMRGCTGGERAIPEELLARRADGRVKMFVTTRALAARTELRNLYQHGDYVPLEGVGPRRDCLFAFARKDHESIALTCVPRLIASLVPDATSPPLGRAVWADTRIDLSTLAEANGPAGGWGLKDVFTGATIEAERIDGVPTLPAATLFDRFPVALLVRTSR
jgi:(1->4)-alpha-D-glucan 1-alpha-D-glucosylmutase